MNLLNPSLSLNLLKYLKTGLVVNTRLNSNSKSSRLFTPLKLRGVTLKNRIVVSPMCTYSSEDGFPNDWHLVNYGGFATSGVGLIVVEATGVEARGRISPRCLGLWKDEQISAYKPITKFIKSQGSVPGIQLAHGGRKAATVPPFAGKHSIPDEEGGWSTIGASPIEFGDSVWRVPKEASIDDIEIIKQAWVNAAIRSVEAGFEVIELHFAHGYLVSSFMSPHSNKRTDKYGGSLENRMRLGIEIAEAVRKVVPQDLVIGARISVTDYKEGGWDVDQAKEFSKEMKRIGLDFVDCSSGGIVADVKYHPLLTTEIQHEAAEIIQSDVGIATGAVGKIVDPLFAEKLLQDNKASLIFIGRAFLNNPHWVFDAADALASAESFKYIPQYDFSIGWGGFGKWRQGVFHKAK